jgi:TRAP-type C4-dicarboxylate transport system permease small subunit
VKPSRGGRIIGDDRGGVTMAQERKPPRSKVEKFEVFCGSFVLIAVLISVSEIVLRVGFNTSYDFIIQASVWLTIWGLLLISGPILAEDGHVSIDFVRNRLRGRPQWLLDLFNTGTTLIYALVVTCGGILLVIELLERGTVFPMYFPIPMWAIQIIVPISMGIFSYFAVIRFYRALTGFKK